MLPLCPDFLPTPFSRVNVDHHKEHFVLVAMEVDIVAKIVILHLCPDLLTNPFPHVRVSDRKGHLVVVVAVVVDSELSAAPEP